VPEGTENVPQKVRSELEGNNSGLKQATRKVLQSRGYFVRIEDNEVGWKFVGVKKRLGNWGSFTTHLAFVIVILGALIGSIGGFKGFLLADVGSTNPIQGIEIQKGMTNQNFSVRINSFEPRFLPNGDRENWYTDLSIFNSLGREVARRTISTNHPFTYNGITFYQSSWAISYTIEFGGQKYPSDMSEGQDTGIIQLPGTDISIDVYAGQNLHQPSLSYIAYKGMKQVQQGQVQAGKTVNIQKKCTLSVGGWATGLQVKHDPGTPVILVGSILILIGLLLSFYWRPVNISGVFETTGGDTGKLIIGIAAGKVLLDSTTKELANITEKISED
jgi:cytochrome c biogenesis protein